MSRMTACGAPASSTVSRRSPLISAVESLQQAFPTSDPRTLDAHLVRALRVKQGDIDLAVLLASTFASLDVVACSGLQLEPLTSVAVPQIAQYSDAATSCALMTACEAAHQAMHRKGRKVVPHITHRLPSLKSFDEGSVLSLTVLENSCPGVGLRKAQAVTLAKSLPSCRVAWWRPLGWRAKHRGEYIESKPFALQEIGGVYFRFYPRGKEQSRKGFCSLYIGSDGTLQDVSLRVLLGDTSRIITQRFNGEYVDGFVNFCDMSEMKDVLCGVEVLHGPLDPRGVSMRVVSGPRTATWTVPRLTSMKLQTGDRITSDVFSVRDLGEDACFVLYPKGDDVDPISNIADFANVGLFGSSANDVTFRLSAGRVSKVLTASPERYKSKLTGPGQTKSCGEFFDSCFGQLGELLNPSADGLKLTLDVLDTTAKQELCSRGSSTKWTLKSLNDLVVSLRPDEALHSRYFSLPNCRHDVYFNMMMSFGRRSIRFGLRQINREAGLTRGRLLIIFWSLDTIGRESSDGQYTRIVDVSFDGLTDEHWEEFAVTPSGDELSLLKVDIQMLDYVAMEPDGL